ncbi:hypothetical protein GCM10027614_63550 [Micromonospora vulcania]
MVGHEVPEEPGDLLKLVPGKCRVDRRVQLGLDVTDLSGDPATLVGEGQFNVASVVLGDLAPDEFGSHEPIDQPAGVHAALADEQFAEPGQRQRLPVLQESEHLGLGGCDAQGRNDCASRRLPSRCAASTR